MTLTAATTVIGPRPVVCVIDHLRRDVRTAVDASNGLFTHAGVRLALGRQPNWISDGLPDDEEWRIEWVKFYEGLDLAHAFSVTGDVEMLDTWCRLVVAFCEQVPVGHDSSDVSARRIQNWLYAWQRFTEAGTRLAPQTAELIIGRLIADVDHLRLNLTAERNHRTLELYTLLLASLSLGDALDPADDLRRFAVDQLAINADLDVWSDGVHRECSTDYHHIVLRSFLGTIANAERFDLELSPGFIQRVHAACDFALHVQRPDGTIPSFSDGDNGDFRDVLALAGSLLDRHDLTWAATGGASGAPPASCAMTFPVGGYVVQRSGWGAGDRSYDDELFALFDCGPIGDGGHGHYDQLHVELVAGRQVLAVDPGRFTYADDPWRQWFKGTSAHNTVTVDDVDQIPYRRGKPKGATSAAALLSRSTCDKLDLVVGQVRSPRYDAVHTRGLAFVDRRYWVVHDLLDAATSHKYTVRWHLAPGADPVSIGRLHSGGCIVTTAHARFIIAAPAEVRLEEGWVSESYGHKQMAWTIAATVHASTADLLTLVLPHATAGQLSLDAISGGASECLIELRGGMEDPDLWERFHWTTHRRSEQAEGIADVIASWHRIAGDDGSTGRLLLARPQTKTSTGQTAQSETWRAIR